MNLINGLENSPWGFPIAMIISIVVSIATWMILRHKRLI
jgi:magnesium transporter